MTHLDWSVVRAHLFAGLPYAQQGFAGLPVVPAGSARYSAVAAPSSEAPAPCIRGVRLHRDTQPFDGTPLDYVVVSILFEGEWREIIRALADNNFDDAIYSW